MSKSKLVFLVLALFFILLLILFAIDISSRTSFPGQDKSNPEIIEADTISQE